jgi:hypothetical protein
VTDVSAFSDSFTFCDAPFVTMIRSAVVRMLEGSTAGDVGATDAPARARCHGDETTAAPAPASAQRRSTIAADDSPISRNPPPTYPLLDLLSISSMTGTHRHETEQHGSETQAAVPKVVVPSSQKKVRTVRSRSARR